MVYLVIMGFLIPLAARRNPFRMLLTIRFQDSSIILAAFLLQLLLVLYTNQTGEKLPYALAFTFMLVLIALYRNRQMAGISWIFIGASLNFLALLLNHGSMPVSLKALEWAGLQDLSDFSHASRHQAMNNNWTGWLGDWIPLVVPFGKSYILSLGDMIVGIGIMILIYQGSPRRRELQ